MDHVLVTVKRVNEARVRDIMLPSDMPIGQLAALLAEKLEWNRDANDQPVSYMVEADPPGRYLRQDETLAQAGAWDGSWLVFHPRVGGAANAAGLNVPDAPGGKSPLRGWSRLFRSRPSEPRSDNPAGRRAAESGVEQPVQPDQLSGYTMKRIDNDPPEPPDGETPACGDQTTSPAKYGFKRIDGE